jgi:hypothetical protein
MTLPLLRRLHKWVALIVGIQVLLWSVSGAMFAWLDHDEVQGTHLAQRSAPISVPAEFGLADPRSLVSSDTHEVRLRRVGEQWAYRVASASGTQLYDATSAAPLAIDAATASALALARYAGEGSLAGVTLHGSPTLETRKHGPAWEAKFDDELGTTLWLAADDGRLLETRTDAWRLFDIFWMLHTMDYEGRDDFNHPLVILFATSALWVALTGFWLVVRVFRKPRAAARAESAAAVAGAGASKDLAG